MNEGARREVAAGGAAITDKATADVTCQRWLSMSAMAECIGDDRLGVMSVITVLGFGVYICGDCLGLISVMNENMFRVYISDDCLGCISVISEGIGDDRSGLISVMNQHICDA